MYSCRAKSSFDRSPFLTAATIVVRTSSWKPSSSMKKGGKSSVNFNSFFQVCRSFLKVVRLTEATLIV